MKVGDLLTYKDEIFYQDNPWNGKKAILLEDPLSDVISANSVLRVYIGGKEEHVAAVYFEELVRHFGWRYGI